MSVAVIVIMTQRSMSPHMLTQHLVASGFGDSIACGDVLSVTAELFIFAKSLLRCDTSVM